jgi:hypothetical protein
MTTLIIIYYIIPMILAAVFFWMCDNTKTIGHFLSYCPYYLIPVFNIFTILVIILDYFIYIIKKNEIGKKINTSWNRFMNIKIK